PFTFRPGRGLSGRAALPNTATTVSPWEDSAFGSVRRHQCERRGCRHDFDAKLILCHHPVKYISRDHGDFPGAAQCQLDMGMAYGSILHTRAWLRVVTDSGAEDAQAAVE